MSRRFLITCRFAELPRLRFIVIGSDPTSAIAAAGRLLSPRTIAQLTGITAKPADAPSPLYGMATVMIGLLTLAAVLWASR